MKKYLLPLLFAPLAFADPEVKNVQVNFHNDSRHTIKLQKFDASRIYENVTILGSEIAPFSSTDNVIQFFAFDTYPMTVQIPAVFNDEAVIFMWQTNMGYALPGGEKFHICGVIRDGKQQPEREYCDIPYVIGDTMYIDYTIQ